jgi:O-antigen ligase
MMPIAERAEVGRADTAVAISAPSPFLTLGFLGFCFYAFAFYSRILDLGPARLHLPGIAFGFAVVVAVLSGRIIEVLQHRIALCLVGLSLWLAAAVAWSSWRGGSFAVFTKNWIPAMLLFLVGGAVIGTLAQCRRSLYVVGLASAAGAMLVMLQGKMSSEQRLVLEGSSFSNSNTLAITLLMGMPMVWLLAAGSRAGFFRKALIGGVLILMLVALFRSGSREGVVGLGVLGLTTFVRSSLVGKVKIAIAAAALMAGAALFLPQSLKSRFGTTFDGATVDLQDAGSAEEQISLISAGGSSQNRWQLLVSSLELTRQHPLLGVGPGQFASYVAKQSAATGAFALWVGTHNTYTQLSSEAGIPALCLYVAVLLSSIGALQRILRRARLIQGEQARDIAATALVLQTSFIAFCVCAMFNHMAYEMAMPLMAGITVAISRAAPGELSRLEDAARVQKGVPGSVRLVGCVLPNRS